MDQLKQLMVFRASFINSFKNKIQTLQTQNLQLTDLIHQLLNEKKKMLTNQSLESKHYKSLIIQKIQSPYKLMQFYESSKLIMKSFSNQFLSESDSEEINKSATKNKNYPSQNLQSSLLQTYTESQIFKPEKYLNTNMQNKSKLITKIIRLYYQFFKSQNSQSKAQEIMHIYKKKLCEENQIVPTLFCWLNDWISKQFVNFIKKQISKLNTMENGKKSMKNPELSQLKIKQPKFQSNNQQKNQIQNGTLKINENKIKKSSRSNNVDMFFSIDLNEKRSFSQMKTQSEQFQRSQSKQSKVKQLKDKEDDFFRPRNNLSLGSPQIFLTIQKSKQAPPIIKYKHIQRARRYFSSQTSNLIGEKAEKNIEPTMKEIQTNQGDNFPINREIFIGAYYDKFTTYYKSFQGIIADLDNQYVKHIKRNDRKVQLRRRIRQVHRIFIRTQPVIKTSIDTYFLYYKQKNDRSLKLSHKKDLISQQRPKQNEIIETQSLQKDQNLLSQERPTLDLKSQLNTPLNSYRYSLKQEILKTNDKAELSFHKKKEQKTKSVFSLQKSIEFQFTLPRIPDHQKGVQSKPKENSKIVLIQSGRYKVLETPKPSQSFQIQKRKNNHRQLYIQSTLKKKQNNSQILESKGQKRQSLEKFDQKSASILSMITKKKKKSSSKKNKKLSNHQNFNNFQTFSRNRKVQSPKILRYSQKQDYKVPQQIVKAISDLQSNNQFYTLSGWQKGQQTPLTN